MKLLLYDVTLSGHHGAYLAAISREAVKRKLLVSILLPKREQGHPQIVTLNKIIGGENILFSDYGVDGAPPTSRLSLLVHHIAQHRAAAESLKQIRRQYDFVYASNIDYMDKAIQLLGTPCFPTPFGGMCMRARFHMRSIKVDSARSRIKSRLEEIAFRRLLRRSGLLCVTTADPSLAEYCDTHAPERFRKVRYVPEMGMRRPVTPKVKAKATLGFEPEDRVILVYGAISRRKAVEELLEALDMQETQSRLKALIVGQADEEMKKTLKARTIRRSDHSFKFVAGFANEQTEELAFSAADAVWIAYKGHSTMSGVFFQAICSRIPVIAPDYGVLKWLVDRHQVGITVKVGDTRETATKLATMFQTEAEYTGYCNNAESISSAHQPENFGRAVCDAISDSIVSARL